MLTVYTCFSTEYDVRLVILAVSIGLITSIAAFTLADHIRATGSQGNLPWMGGLAFVSGGGIWATHFIAMLSYQPEVPFDDATGLTVASVMITILAAVGGWVLALSRRRIAAVMAGMIMATGMALMDYLGMAALWRIGRSSYDKGMAIEAILIAVLLAIAAQISFRCIRSRLPIVSAMLFASAIYMTHFGLVAAVMVPPLPEPHGGGNIIDRAALSAMICAIVLIALTAALAAVFVQRRLIKSACVEVLRLKSFAEGAQKGLAILDDTIICDANDMFWVIAGLDPASPPFGIDIRTILPSYEAGATEARETDFQPIDLMLAGGAIANVEVGIQRACLGGKARDLLLLRTISTDRTAAAQLAHLLSHDALTGAGTRVAFEETLDNILARESSVALLCLDLDRFQAINELYSHATGDAVLVEVARRIRECLSDREDLARMGGDEFAVIQRGGEQPGRAAELAARILDAIAEDMTIDDVTLHVGSSIGIGLHATDASTADDLHTKAHLALRRAKLFGRGQHCFFDAFIDQQLLEKHQLEADLRGAMAASQFHLHYQPITSLLTGQATAFEALLRWNHPKLGDISPAVFVPIAEEIGLIGQIGEWVFREACREAASWPNPLKISVNFSAAQLTPGDTEQFVRSVLEETGLDPHRLDIEVTEGVLIKDADNALAILHALKATGVGISMDDFGTGYSSLSYFRLFPFDKVKIDQSFVHDMGDNPQAAKLVNAIIGLGQTLGLSVIAEGVETVDQLDLLRDLGCDQVQGYYTGRPAPMEQFGHLIQRRGIVHGLADGAVPEMPAHEWHRSARRRLAARLA
jgi:diguanylate cyclase (GGDEF)-like protein